MLGGNAVGSVEKRKSASVLMRVCGPAGFGSVRGTADVRRSKALLSMVRTAGLILAVCRQVQGGGVLAHLGCVLLHLYVILVLIRVIVFRDCGKSRGRGHGC